MINRSYFCDSCSHTFEVKQPMLKPLKKKCPKCGKKKLYQDLTGTPPPIIMTPRTVGNLADRHSKKMDKPKGNPSWYNTSGQNLKKDLREVISNKEKTKRYIMEGR